MCEDPFHNNYTTDILERPCMGGRKNRNGLFPAAACIKVAGTYCKKKASKFHFMISIYYFEKNPKIISF